MECTINYSQGFDYFLKAYYTCLLKLWEMKYSVSGKCKFSPRIFRISYLALVHVHTNGCLPL